MTRAIARALSVAAVLAGGVVACGGSSGEAAPPRQGRASGAVSATGVLVDHESGLPLAGEAVGLAPWSAGAAAVPQGTTASDGSFTVSAATSGEYLLVIGSDSSNDTTRPTIHDAILLTGGPQVLVAPTMPPVPSETPNPIEASGKFRLTTLTNSEAACLTEENSVRAQHAYAPVISDEWLTENNRMNWQRTVDTGQYGGMGTALTNYSGEWASAYNCTPMIAADYANVQDALSMSGLTWYGADAGGAQNANAQELGMFDPRAAMPAPTPPVSWP